MTDINAAQLLNQIRTMTQSIEKPLADSGEGSGSVGGFGEIFKSAMGSVNHLMQEADSMKVNYELGDSSVSLAGVKIAEQEASIAFQASLQVRNKLLDAYRNVMEMPV
jgi:flagellar hook-basal body complex protein FliE